MIFDLNILSGDFCIYCSIKMSQHEIETIGSCCWNCFFQLPYYEETLKKVLLYKPRIVSEMFCKWLETENRGWIGPINRAINIETTGSHDKYIVFINDIPKNVHFADGTMILSINDF